MAQIRVADETRDKLRAQKTGNDTYDDVVCALLEPETIYVVYDENGIHEAYLQESRASKYTGVGLEYTAVSLGSQE